MKAIGIKMVELQPMFSGEARIKGYKELDDRINKLASFINTNSIFETLQDEEREDMKAQLIWMHKYISVLANRLRRQNVEPSKLLDK